MTSSAPYGTWSSPITAEDAAAGATRLCFIQVDGDDVYWLETRAEEDGRSVIVCRSRDGTVVDVTPPGFAVRSAVHWYGGGAYTVSGGIVYFVNGADQRIYKQAPGADPVALTPESSPKPDPKLEPKPGRWLSYADTVIDPRRKRAISVMEAVEIKSEGGPPTVTHSIVAVPTDGRQGGPPTVLVSGKPNGADFYSNPRISPDGKRLAWLSWSHPQMPWDGTDLWVADIAEDGSLSGHQLVAGGMDESIFQPEWSPDNVLHFVSDRSGWWNLYRVGQADVERLTKEESELARPQWEFGYSTYDFTSDGRIVCTPVSGPSAPLLVLDRSNGTVIDVRFSPYDLTGYTVKVCGDRIVFDASSWALPSAVIAVPVGGGSVEVLGRSGEPDPKLDGCLSKPEQVEFPMPDGSKAYGVFYLPTNRDYEGLPGELPPLIVRPHGGPTAAANRRRDLEIQFFTSRGFAFLDVDYPGSTGYGREYREKLKGNWGALDVEACIVGAEAMAAGGRVDRDRMAILGHSAGGFTALAAACSRVFRAVIILSGIGDLFRLATGGSHFFESQYMLDLIGGTPEKNPDIYDARSPAKHLDLIDPARCSVIVFHGGEDVVAPIEQANESVQGLRNGGVPVDYHVFRDEEHWFSEKATVIRVLETQLAFLQTTFEISTPGRRGVNLPGPSGPQTLQ